jgi:hypothetical protein
MHTHTRRRSSLKLSSHLLRLSWLFRRLDCLSTYGGLLSPSGRLCLSPPTILTSIFYIHVPKPSLVAEITLSAYHQTANCRLTNLRWSAPPRDIALSVAAPITLVSHMSTLHPSLHLKGRGDLLEDYTKPALMIVEPLHRLPFVNVLVVSAVEQNGPHVFATGGVGGGVVAAAAVSRGGGIGSGRCSDDSGCEGGEEGGIEGGEVHSRW